ncbi:DUF3231 family protein [Alicyclobacillus acidiphilus]|uniref:DUF3231 family protein n=1 Tax=Alicyclobacillus acidiphilus TaxID=182455 RepID=UPI00082A2746|nr:DUF3231 family protein [Alicyclobacillus acidiphilus]
MSERTAPITSSELGTLWITYQQKTMLLRMLEYFIKCAEDDGARQIMSDLYGKITSYVSRIQQIFRREGTVIPIGFTAEDVHPSVPKLYDNGFDIMLLRLVKQISMGMHTLNIGMSYREDLVILYKELTAITQECYNACTQYLMQRGLLARSPAVSMPTSIEFVESTQYLGGLNPFAKKRSLNTIEVAHLFHAIESNVTGMHLIMGFAQCANSPEVRKFFSEGTELAKSIIKELSEVLLECGIETPSSWGGNATRSTVAPFSDKLMMYCVSLFCSFSMGGNSLGTAFSLRNDLSAKITVFMKDVFEYAHEGAKLMIRNGWMEEPPQMEERNKLIQA